jgi:hypothetical protein
LQGAGILLKSRRLRQDWSSAACDSNHGVRGPVVGDSNALGVQTTDAGRHDVAGGSIVNFNADLPLGGKAATPTGTLQIAGTLNLAATTRLATTVAGRRARPDRTHPGRRGNMTFSNGGLGIGQFRNAPAPAPETISGVGYLVTASGRAGESTGP